MIALLPDFSTLLFILAIYFIAGFFKGITGLGFSAISVSLLTLGLGFHAAIPLIILPSLASNFLVMVDAGEFKSTAKRFSIMYLATIPGLLLGLYLLSVLDRPYPEIFLSITMIFYALFDLLKRKGEVIAEGPRIWSMPSGFSTGLLNGLTGVQVMPLLPYLFTQKLSPSQLVQAMNISFTLSSLIMLVGLSKLGLFTTSSLLISVLGLLPCFLGVKGGSKVRGYVSEQLFRKLVLGMLIFIAIILLAKNLLF